MTGPAERLRQAAQLLHSGDGDIRADLRKPLAAWLEQEAGSVVLRARQAQRRIDEHPHLYGPEWLMQVLRVNHGPALAVADVILADRPTANSEGQHDG